MAKKIILPISILLGCIILGGFYYFTKIQNNKSITNQQKENFKNKIECGKYQKEIVEKINTYNNSQKIFTADGNNDDSQASNTNQYINSKEFKELFYSPRMNSCVYFEIDQTLIGHKINNKPIQWAVSSEYYNLIDVLTGKQLELIHTVNRGEKMDSYNKDGTVSENIYKNASDVIDNYRN